MTEMGAGGGPRLRGGDFWFAWGDFGLRGGGIPLQGGERGGGGALL